MDDAVRIAEWYTDPIADQRTHCLSHQLTLSIFPFPEIHFQIDRTVEMEDKLHPGETLLPSYTWPIAPILLENSLSEL